jgi:hypothetical protein
MAYLVVSVVPIRFNCYVIDDILIVESFSVVLNDIIEANAYYVVFIVSILVSVPSSRRLGRTK